MPTVTIERPVTMEDIAKALQEQLGREYEVTAHGSGSDERLRVKKSATATATVHLDNKGNATVLHVHGGGLVVSRVVNELGIAKKVAEAITAAFASGAPAS